MRAVFEMQYAAGCFTGFSKKKNAFEENDLGKKLNFGFLIKISQDDLDVILFNTLKLARDLLLGFSFYILKFSEKLTNLESNPRFAFCRRL